MSRKLVDPAKWPKDDSGAYVKVAPEPQLDTSKIDVSIDGLLKQGLLAIQRIMHQCLKETAIGIPDRDVVMTLKDCMVMLHELKKKEQDLLESLTDEQLDELSKNADLK